MTKTCSKCKEAKFLIEFSKDRRGRLGVCVWCKNCTKAYKKSIQKMQNKKRQQKLYTDADYHSYVRARDRAWRRDNPQLHLYRSAKTRAKRNKIAFNLTLEDIIIPTRCPLLGVKFIPGTKENYKYTYSLDRIINSEGYVKGNVRVISALANNMKNEANPEELLNFAKNIFDYLHYK